MLKVETDLCEEALGVGWGGRVGREAAAVAAGIGWQAAVAAGTGWQPAAAAGTGWRAAAGWTLGSLPGYSQTPVPATNQLLG